ncbi:MAG TPA: cbb3-type cytochrome c oxidase subunit I [Gammaproteobacteria bacterium]|nr:cbb3-type cytochrome c oxidase subunit I [Gammaproteobacteria bacterium]
MKAKYQNFNYKISAHSTNHKQIGTLYMILVSSLGIVGLGLSVIIRMELAQPGCLNNSFFTLLYNVAATSHTPAMIFFFVMPFLVGGFFLRLNNLSLQLYKRCTCSKYNQVVLNCNPFLFYLFISFNQFNAFDLTFQGPLTDFAVISTNFPFYELFIYMVSIAVAIMISKVFATSFDKLFAVGQDNKASAVLLLSPLLQFFNNNCIANDTTLCLLIIGVTIFLSSIKNLNELLSSAVSLGLSLSVLVLVTM